MHSVSFLSSLCLQNSSSDPKGAVYHATFVEGKRKLTADIGYGALLHECYLQLREEPAISTDTPKIETTATFLYTREYIRLLVDLSQSALPFCKEILTHDTLWQIDQSGLVCCRFIIHSVTFEFTLCSANRLVSEHRKGSIVTRICSHDQVPRERNLSRRSAGKYHRFGGGFSSRFQRMVGLLRTVVDRDP